MALTVGGTIAAGSALAGISSAMNGFNSTLFGSIQRSWNKKSANADAQRQLRNQAIYDSWYAKNIYPQYQDLDYAMAQRYAENSAKWEVEGLRNAGLNPILAASHGLGGAGVDYNSPSASSGNIGGSSSQADLDTPGSSDLAEAVREIASAELSDTQADVASGTKSSLISSAKADADLKHKQVAIADATKDRILAEAQQIRANTAKTMLESEIVDRPHTFLAETADWATRRAVNVVKHGIDLGKNLLLFRPHYEDNGSTAKHPPRDNPPEVLQINTGKRKADFERDMQEIIRQMNLRSGR